MSYAWGFNQKHEKNIDQEVSATFQASTHEGFDLKVQIPEVILCTSVLLVVVFLLRFKQGVCRVSMGK